MKSLKTVALALLLSVPMLARATTIEVEVNGLVCAFCAQGIEKTLRKFPATQSVYVSLENRLVAVQLKEQGDIEDAALRNAITDAGYTVVAIRRSDASLDAIRARTSKHE